MNLSPEVRALLEKHRPHGEVHLPTPEERDKREAAIARQWSKQWQKIKNHSYQKRSLWPATIPIEFTFADWRPDLQPDQQKARDLGNQAFKIALTLENEPGNVLLNGAPGTGKTSLALAIADKVSRESNQSTMFVNTSELKDMFKKSMHLRDLDDKITDLKRAMKEVQILILDDFGTEGGLITRINEPGYKGVRPDMQSALYEVANARYGQPKTTIVTTNNSDQELNRMYDPKIISRLITKNKANRMAFNGMSDVRAMEV